MIRAGRRRHSPADTVLASSSSALVPSRYGSGLPFQERILGAHPGNPPYLLRVIELVRSPATSDRVFALAAEVYTDAGLTPVFVRKEVEGALLNRLQGALLREAYCLVRDGWPRWRTSTKWSGTASGSGGPLWVHSTVDLNTRGGVRAHAARMGPAYERMGAERGQHDPWTSDLVATVTEQRCRLLPGDRWEERVRWRYERLILLRLFNDLQEQSCPRP